MSKKIVPDGYKVIFDSKITKESAGDVWDALRRRSYGRPKHLLVYNAKVLVNEHCKAERQSEIMDWWENGGVLTVKPGERIFVLDDYGNITEITQFEERGDGHGPD